MVMTSKEKRKLSPPAGRLAHKASLPQAKSRTAHPSEGAHTVKQEGSGFTGNKPERTCTLDVRGSRSDEKNPQSS